MYSTYNKYIRFTPKNITNIYFNYASLKDYANFYSKFIYIIKSVNKV